jgi:hypothetical protein
MIRLSPRPVARHHESLSVNEYVLFADWLSRAAQLLFRSSLIFQAPNALFQISHLPFDTKVPLIRNAFGETPRLSETFVV